MKNNLDEDILRAITDPIHNLGRSTVVSLKGYKEYLEDYKKGFEVILILDLFYLDEFNCNGFETGILIGIDRDAFGSITDVYLDILDRECYKIKIDTLEKALVRVEFNGVLIGENYE